MRTAPIFAGVLAGMADAVSWTTTPNANACLFDGNTGICGGVPQDHVGKVHYAGVTASADACAATCTGNATCPVWLWSAGSKHCWWRIDGEWAATPARGITSGCRSDLAQCGSFTTPTPPPTPQHPTPPPAPWVPTTEGNMNGEYFLSNAPGQNATGLFPTHFKDYPGGVKYFDILSPVFKTHYSQVWWAALGAVPLPADVVKEFDGKVMSVVGFELNQVSLSTRGGAQCEELPQRRCGAGG
jgi:hypothetical protein